MRDGYRNTHDYDGEEHGYEPYSWGSFAFGIILGVILVYIFAVRPSEEQLHDLNIRVSRMDRSVEKLGKAAKTITGTNDLLVSLEQQKDLAQRVSTINDKLLAQFARLSKIELAMNDAEVTLDRIASLHDRVAQQYPAAIQAENVFNQSASLNSQLILAQDDVRRAKLTLADLVNMQNNVLLQAEHSKRADLVMSNIFAMQRELAENASRTEKARRVADQMIQIEADLICQTGDSQFAVQSLEQLLTMQKQLNRAGRTMEDGQSTVGELVAREQNPQPASSPSSLGAPWKAVQSLTTQQRLLPINAVELQRFVKHLTQDAPPYVADLVAPAAKVR
ncbi:hypothetical protein [Bremerella cremea]|uniref:hypothetical protein n=1 Tax=Bremerella cremea TaxID=1031537 RepID=UPI0031EE999A